MKYFAIAFVALGLLASCNNQPQEPDKTIIEVHDKTETPPPPPQQVVVQQPDTGGTSVRIDENGVKVDGMHGGKVNVNKDGVEIKTPN
ncbi:MAG: hypothetical protein U0V74_01340 [Chitinophagales bacterium]